MKTANDNVNVKKWQENINTWLTEIHFKHGHNNIDNILLCLGHVHIAATFYMWDDDLNIDILPSGGRKHVYTINDNSVNDVIDVNSIHNSNDKCKYYNTNHNPEKCHKLINYTKAEEFLTKNPEVMKNITRNPHSHISSRLQRNNQLEHNQKQVNNVEEEEYYSYSKDDQSDTSKHIQNTNIDGVNHINEDNYNCDSDHEDYCKETYASVLCIEESFGKGADVITKIKDE